MAHFVNVHCQSFSLAYFELHLFDALLPETKDVVNLLISYGLAKYDYLSSEA